MIFYQPSTIITKLMRFLLNDEHNRFAPFTLLRTDVFPPCTILSTRLDSALYICWSRVRSFGNSNIATRDVWEMRQWYLNSIQNHDPYPYNWGVGLLAMISWLNVNIYFLPQNGTSTKPCIHIFFINAIFATLLKFSHLITNGAGKELNPLFSGKINLKLINFLRGFIYRNTLKPKWSPIDHALRIFLFRCYKKVFSWKRDNLVSLQSCSGYPTKLNMPFRT
jgi:hypothetical protein